MNDASESVDVHPGCRLTLFEHGPRYNSRLGRVHTFTHDDGSIDMPENDNFGVVGLANNTSSWECSCNGVPVENPLTCEENENDIRVCRDFHYGCATIYDGTNQQGASADLPVGAFEFANPRGFNDAIGHADNPSMWMALNDASESVRVQPGCSLTLFEHGPRYSRGTGIVHTFTHDDGSTDMPENDDFAVLGLANNISSWECSCNGTPVEHPLPCEENENDIRVCHDFNY